MSVDRIEELQQRVHRMQGTASSRALPTLPALTPVVRLRTGVGYSTASSLLAMMMLAGPSRSGGWAAVVGVPDFGLEAAAALGVALERTVVVPEPGAAWLSVTAALVEVMGMVVVRPPAAVPPAQAERLSARLRQRDATLIALTRGEQDWPRAEARLTLHGHDWDGIGRGHGHLRDRRVTVSARHGGRVRTTELWLVDGVPVAPPDPVRLSPVRSDRVRSDRVRSDRVGSDQVGSASDLPASDRLDPARLAAVS